MRISGILLVLGCFCLSQVVAAQSPENGTSRGTVFSGLIRFEEGQQPMLTDWQNAVRRKMGLPEDVTWKIYSEISDELGQVHYRAQQYYQHIPLEYGVIILHTYQGRILSFNGEIIPIAKLSGTTSETEGTALETALKLFPSNAYYWSDAVQNSLLQEVTGNKDTSYFPKAKKVYCARDLNYKNLHRLCYKFQIYSTEPLFGKTVYIDAENLELVAVEELILHTDVKGAAVTAYSGTRKITTDSLAPGNYRLREKARGKGIETYNLKNGTTYGAAVDFTDADNYWNNVNLSQDEVATDAHWGAEKTYDFYDSVLSRKSFDNSNAKILSYVHYSTNYANAFWNGACMTYGDGNGSTWKPLTALDVCGHEISHAVTTYTAGLVYSYESGALNESFSDIFGNAIEYWARPKKHSWKIGEDFTTSGGGIRDMSNPNLFNNPKYYKGNKWYTGTGDNGGVHTNSGVQNYWFYLISDGIAGTNEKGDIFDIDSLGIMDASRIAYRNLSVYLTKNAQYADARIYSIISAADLFGNCAKHVIAVTNAWWACGVGAKYDSGFVKANFYADTLVCSLSKAVKFNNRSENSLNSSWYFGDGNTSTAFSPVHYYSKFGKFDIKLVAKSCFKNKYDSMTRTAYVVVDSTYDICNAVLMPSSGTDSVVKCYGFIYDDGGEGDYGALRQTNLKVNIPGATSIRFRFLVMDYENGYDSIELFKNTMTGVNRIGRFTGQTLPFGGAWQTITASALWLRHFSDPLVEGKGFKIEFEGIRDPLTLDLGKDTTICYGDSLHLKPVINGGYAPDYRYVWSNGTGAAMLHVLPLVTTKYRLTLRDACTNKTTKDSVMVFVRKALKISLQNDTLICAGNPVKLQALATGGIPSSYVYTWNNGLGNLASHTVSPAVTTTYMVILNDGCSEIPDTAYQTIYVKPALKISISATDTLLCIGKTVGLTTQLSGGDTSGYKITWNQGLGTGVAKSAVVLDTAVFIATLSDGCTVKSASDTLTIFTYPPLQMQLNSDTTLCRGRSVNLTAQVSGGNGKGYYYTWNNGKTTATITEQPLSAGYYKVQLSDACSPDIRDSVYVDLLAPLSLSKVADTSICDGQNLPVNLVASGGKSTGYSIAWNQPVSGFSPVLNPVTGITPYRAILSDGCTVMPDTTSFDVTKLAPLIATITLTPSAVCQGDSMQMQFNFSGGKTNAWSWTLNGSTVAFKKQKIQPLAATAYNLILTDGCSIASSASASATVYAPAMASLQATPLLICSGTPVVFHYNSSDAAAVKWYFSSGDSALATTADYNQVFNKAGKYTARIKITTSNGCVGWFDLADTVAVVAYPKAFYKPVPPVANLDNPQIFFDDLSSGGADYVWDFGDGKSATTAGSVVYNYADTGWYRTSLTVSVAPGCADSMSYWVRIKDVYKLFRPTGFTPDGNNINDNFIPAGRGIKTYHIAIFNRWGMKVFESKDMSVSWNGKDDSGNYWAPGTYVYIIKILDTDDISHIEKGTVVLVR